MVRWSVSRWFGQNAHLGPPGRNKGAPGNKPEALLSSVGSFAEPAVRVRGKCAFPVGQCAKGAT